MMDKVEMSLDDIISQTKKTSGGAGRKFTGRGRGRPGRVAGGGIGGGGGPRRRNSGNLRQQYTRATGDIDGRWQHDMYDGPAARRQAQNAMGGGGNSAKLIVSNLDFGVSDADVTELFGEFGSLKQASIHYDRSGRSLGVADVSYERRADALKALKQYNNVPLDGRPMKIKFADEGNPVSPGGGIRNSGRIQKPQTFRPRGRGGFGRGGGGGGGRGRGRKSEVTADELDAELDAWKKAA